jgi:Stress up-regulated Nod 19
MFRRSRRRPLFVAVLLALAVSAMASAPALANHDGEHVKLLRYGPFTMPGGTFHDEHGHVHGAHFTTRLTNVQKPCTNCHITRFFPLFRYADNSEANHHTNAWLHHAVWSNSSRRDLTCPTRNERFFASGNERTAIVLPPGYGYRVGGGDRWNLSVHAMNESEQPQTVYVDLIVLYRTGPGVQSVTPTWFDIDLCGDSEYTIPAGLSNANRTFPAPFNGKLVAIGGHLHDDGIYIELHNEASGKVLCKSNAGYDTKPNYEGHIESMTRCEADPVGTFRQGDPLRMYSVYYSDTVQTDVMGIMLGYSVPTG